MAVEETLKGKAARGLFWGGLSTMGQQVMSLFFGILLARLLSPEDYGLFNMLIIFTSLAALLQDSGFTIALVNKKNATDADYNSVFWFSCFVGLILYAIGFVSAPYIAAFYHSPELEPAARIMFLWFVFGCTCTVHNAVIIKHLMIKERAKADLISFVVSCIIGVILAFNGAGFWALIIQMLSQGVVNCILRWYYSPWRPSLSFNTRPLKEFFPFSVKILITGLFNVANNNIFSIILGRFYSKALTGYYAQGYKWGYIAYSVIWGMVNNVSQPVLAEVANDPERQNQVFRKLIRFVSYVTFPTMLGLAFVAPEFISVTVTDKWAESVPYMQLFCLWGIITPINNLCTNTIISKGKSNIFMYGTIALDIVQLSVIYLTAGYGLINMVISFIIVNFCWFFVWFYFVNRMIGTGLLTLLFRDILPFIAISAVSIAIAWFVTSGISNIYLLLTTKIVIVAACYIITLYLCKSVLLTETIQYLRKIFKK